MTWLIDSKDSDRLAGPDEMHDQPGTELAPGVIIERRTILRMSAAALTGLLMVGRRAAGTQNAEAAANAQLDWDVFLKQAVPVATEAIVDGSPAGQDAYLHRVAALAVRLQAAPATKLFAFGGLKPRVEFAPSFRGKPFVVIQWRMEPHAVLPAHCHPGTSVCTVGVEGEARVRHFEIEGDAPTFDSGSSRAFQIRETRSQLVSPHRVSTLSATRDNIHYFEAGPQGARGLDITTMHAGTGHFSFVAFEPERPRDPKRRVYEAAWTGEKLPS
jgi:hypothetical protein